MAFNETTVADAIQSISRSEYVLPAIQREFVWGPDRICQLFDSLMQDFPVGQLLFWKINKEKTSHYRFYRFMRNYHARDAFRCVEAEPDHGGPLIGVLDGQQRLTALNIGLRGSMAIKKPYGRWSSDDSFPKQTLHLDLTSPLGDEADGTVYNFKFFAVKSDLPHSGWFPVAKIMTLKAGPAMVTWLRTERGIEGDELEQAYERLDRLHRVVHVEKPLAYFTETSQDLDRVLQIFIRVNSKGMVLSYSDLLLSIATAQWAERDARDAVHNLVDNLNEVGPGYSFSKDFVLKAGLMLLDIKSVGFKVENFGRENMALMESEWDRIRDALLLTVKLVAGMGFDGNAIRADSALLPIAYYIFHRKLGSKYLSSTMDSGDRAAIKGWLARSYLKASGIWGSGLDVMLTALREQIKKHGETQFPLPEIEREMARRGRSLVFSDEEIEELLEIGYGEKRLLPLLTLLYPFIDTRHHIHVDHIYPRSHFTRAKLRKAGINQEEAEKMMECIDRVANLQLLDGLPNQEKSAAFPESWLKGAFSTKIQRQAYMDRHDLRLSDGHEGWIRPGDDATSFQDFYDARYERLKQRIKELVG
ncbi:DUF262 domain-containing protein [Paracoccus aestuarii]|uniref:DUF262 domain-containing protein n=1 Tax=Paracoccus aestuarii TaxID=453842 RepID=A0A418ZVT7_9RHOB|nr:DUF262 domain-containing protein [Paracoccus aestuarii]RJL03332.1 DUF262 domain-containing protein [Paracoccus aestuarii]WCR01339.1 DUF262 domain-containing protein [Paracoccus aestuarii]